MTDFGYPKSNRLLKAAEFKAVFNNPIFKVHQPHLMVFVSESETNQARLGMAITKKKVPTAVARNRIKRIIKEQFRLTYAVLPALDIVFIIKKSPQQLSNKQLRDEITTILRKTIHKASSGDKQRHES